ncbi:MAG: type II secretion system F family protein [Candidatus Eremiobacteraeota bacterium]|nr:type II secretion system F family protein [Candidatus Eremiobacteraeota bacterium]MCW5869545.1 type II secretion system F family protein [Candidatus Eremiobacteraeota bacterium]
MSTPPVEEQPKRPAKFQPRWRQNTAEPPPEATPEAPPAQKKFQARWRQNTAEPEPAEVILPPVEENATRLHPNLQQPSEATEKTKGFQPRWRQRAQERAAKEEEARAQAPPVGDKPGFQPRWRRTAASGPVPNPTTQPLPGSDAPLEGQSPKPKGFQPRWRERAEREPVTPPAKAEFTPRWKRTMAAESPPPPPLEIPQEEPASTTEPTVEAETIALPLEVPEVPTETPPATLPETAPEPIPEVPLELTGAPSAEAEAVPLELAGAPAAEVETSFDFTPVAMETPLALAPEPPQALPLGPEESTTEMVATPAPPEKRRLPRPQAPPPPKVVLEPAAPPRPIVGTGVPIPNTEDDDYQPPPTVTVPSFLPGPEALETNVEKARLERTTSVETEIIPETPRQPKRLDDEAMAALKATANAVTRGTPISATPPAPPPPPPPQVVTPRYIPAPKPTSTASSGIIVAGLKPAPAPSKTQAKKKRRLFFWKSEKSVVGLEDVATFTRQFSVMIGAGLPIHQALSFFADSSTGPLADIMDDVASKISSGHRLSQALGKHEGTFSEVYVGLIELGETSSHIDEALEKLADLLEKQVRLGKRMSSALVYPAFLVAVSLASIGVFLQYVLPTMIPLFASFSMQLPLPTRMLLASRHLVIPVAILALLMVVLWQWFRPRLQRARRNKEKWAYKADKLLFKLPMLGNFFQQMATARVLFALATMIETGLPILNALKRCETVASNLAFAERLEKAGVELRDGSTVTDALALYEVLPPSCLHLLSAGEESAQMAEMVQYAARFYEEEVEHSIDTFMSLVEPVIMIVMGIVVGFIVLSAVLPTVEMINHLGS